MGRNKAFLTLKGRMFLWIIIEALSPLFDDLILVTREPERYEGFPVRRVNDILPERGPLTGLFSGLSASQDQKNFCVGCDMPMIKTDLIQYMMNMAYDVDAVIPSIQDPEKNKGAQLEPLHAVYDKECLFHMERNLSEGRRSLSELVRSLNVRYLSEREMARYDPDLGSFWNINRPQEYQSLMRKA